MPNFWIVVRELSKICHSLWPSLCFCSNSSCSLWNRQPLNCPSHSRFDYIAIISLWLSIQNCEIAVGSNSGMMHFGISKARFRLRLYWIALFFLTRDRGSPKWSYSMNPWLQDSFASTPDHGYLVPWLFRMAQVVIIWIQYPRLGPLYGWYGR
jgi:hypothetical protein